MLHEVTAHWCKDQGFGPVLPLPCSARPINSSGDTAPLGLSDFQRFTFGLNLNQKLHLRFWEAKTLKNLQWEGQVRKAEYLSLAKAFKYHLDEEFPSTLLDKQTHHSSNVQGCRSHQQAEKRCNGKSKRHQNKKRQDPTEILPLIFENGKTHSGSGISRLGCMHH